VTKELSCRTAGLIINQMTRDGESSNASRPSPEGDKSIAGLSIKEGSMDFHRIHGADMCKLFKREMKKPELGNKTLISIAVWVAIVVMMILSFVLDTKAHAMELTASYYSTESLIKEGTWKNGERMMANGRQFSDDNLTAASWDYPLGTTVKVVRPDTKASVVVLVTDRTARRFKGKRIDLSKGAFGKIADHKLGIVPVTTEVVR